MARVLGADLLQKQAGLVRFFLAQEALTEMGTSIDVGRVTFQRCTITGFGFVEFAFLEIDVAESEMVMGFVEVMDLRLQLFDATSVVNTRQFESSRRRWRGAIDAEEIPDGADQRENKDEHGPAPIVAADGVDQHPDLKSKRDRQPGLIPDQVPIERQESQRGHACAQFGSRNVCGRLQKII